MRAACAASQAALLRAAGRSGAAAHVLSCVDLCCTHLRNGHVWGRVGLAVIICVCVFNDSCAALQKKKVGQLPVKSKKLKVRNRFFNYLVVSDDNDNTIIQKRTAKGIWHNLYEFPLIETEKDEDFENITKQIQSDSFKENNPSVSELAKQIKSILEYNPESIIHKLSHQHLHIKFWKVKVQGVVENGIDATTLKTFPFPIVIHNFIEKDFLN